MEGFASIRNFIIENFIFEDDGSLKEDTSFLQDGIIDSTGILELVTFLEDTYGIHVEDQEIIPENLDALSNIKQYLLKKLGALSQNKIRIVDAF